MLYRINNSELKPIANFYKIDIKVLAEKLNLDDAILNFEPFEKGVKVETRSGQNLTFFFKK